MDAHHFVKQDNARVLNELAISEQAYIEKMTKCVTDDYVFVYLENLEGSLDCLSTE